MCRHTNGLKGIQAVRRKATTRKELCKCPGHRCEPRHKLAQGRPHDCTASQGQTRPTARGQKAIGQNLHGRCHELEAGAQTSRAPRRTPRARVAAKQRMKPECNRHTSERVDKPEWIDPSAREDICWAMRRSRGHSGQVRAAKDLRNPSS